MTRKDSDPKRVSSAVDALEQAKLRLGKARTMMIVEMRGILTAEQWQMLLDRREEWHRERADARRFGRRGMGDGQGARPERPTPGTE
jgi:hypothetical protein